MSGQWHSPIVAWGAPDLQETRIVRRCREAPFTSWSIYTLKNLWNYQRYPKKRKQRRKPGAHHWWLLAIISVFNERVILFLITVRTRMVGNKLKYKIDCWLFPAVLLLSQIGKILKIAYRRLRRRLGWRFPWYGCYCVWFISFSVISTNDKKLK